MSSLRSNTCVKSNEKLESSFFEFLAERAFDLSQNVDFMISACVYYSILVAGNIFLFHLDKLLFNAILFSLSFASFCYYNLTSEKLKSKHKIYLSNNRRRGPHPGGLLKLDSYYESLNESEIELTNSTSSCSSLNRANGGSQQAAKVFQFDQKSILNLKPTLTDSYLVDDELHKIIELVIRDFIEAWYRPNISHNEEFSQSIRILIYNAIRQINQCLKTVDWEQFFLSFLAQNLLIQMRMFKKARDKVKVHTSATTNSIVNNASVKLTSFKSINSNSQATNEAIFCTLQSIGNANEASLNDLFFELESELEINVCRDCVSSSSSEREKGKI